MAQRKRRVDLARNEEGEFELVLGNRQLVTVFLIVVVLLGVFFSMGYFVARNSPSTAASDAASHPSNPIIVDNSSKSSPPAADSTPASPQPARDATAIDRDNPPGAAKPRAADSAEPAAKPAPMPPRDKPAESAPKPSSGEPQAGQTFLQVVATSRPDAELIAETLAKKGFHTSVAAGPSAALFRVLVGPLNGAADVAETRVRLEAAGFKNPYVRKY